MDSLISDVKFEIISFLDYGILIEVIPLIDKTFYNITKTAKYKLLINEALTYKTIETVEVIKTRQSVKINLEFF